MRQHSLQQVHILTDVVNSLQQVHILTDACLQQVHILTDASTVYNKYIYCTDGSTQSTTSTYTD